MASSGKVPVFLLSSIDFAEFGQAIRIPEKKLKPPDFESEEISFYGALGLFDTKVPIEFGICIYRKRPFAVEQLEQHARTQELLYAIDDDFIMPIAPNTKRGSTNVPDLEKLIAVKIRRGEGVLFHRETWHSVPYPFIKESFALVGFAKDTAKEDLRVFKLDEKVGMKVR
jgi:ureidoglycolate hydrolase